MLSILFVAQGGALCRKPFSPVGVLEWQLALPARLRSAQLERVVAPYAHDIPQGLPGGAFWEANALRIALAFLA